MIARARLQEVHDLQLLATLTFVGLFVPFRADLNINLAFTRPFWGLLNSTLIQMCIWELFAFKIFFVFRCASEFQCWILKFHVELHVDGNPLHSVSIHAKFIEFHIRPCTWSFEFRKIHSQNFICKFLHFPSGLTATCSRTGF